MSIDCLFDDSTIPRENDSRGVKKISSNPREFIFIKCCELWRMKEERASNRLTEEIWWKSGFLWKEHYKSSCLLLLRLMLYQLPISPVANAVLSVSMFHFSILVYTNLTVMYWKWVYHEQKSWSIIWLCTMYIWHYVSYCVAEWVPTKSW